MPTHQDIISQADALIAAGRALQAVQVLTRAVSRDASNPPLLAALAHALATTSDATKAVYHARLAWKSGQGDPPSAARALETLLRCDALAGVASLLESAPPAHVQAYERAMGAALVQGVPAIAERIGAGALARLISDPHATARISMPYASALLALGRPEDAYAFIQRAASTTPHPALAQHRAVIANYCEDDPAIIRGVHEGFARGVEAAVARDKRPVTLTNPNPDRPLCIGLLSGDFRDHSVMWFLRGFLKHRDRKASRLVCFSTQHAEDTAAAFVRTHTDAMHDITGVHPVAARDLVLRERVDVLIDLSGHSWGSSPHLLALKPAPVQMTMIGYPSTTGFSTVDVRVVDAWTDPIGAEGATTERLARLDPCFLCYTPREGVPEPLPRPADAPIVFSSFNALMKHTERTLALWARVLNALPGARLLMKNRGLGDPGVRGTLHARLRRAGIDEVRVDLLPWAPDPADHMRAYQDTDIALDTFPYHGTTTTCEALFMGVPVVSRVGRNHASRVGLSLLTNVGVADLACADDDAFVDAAVALARSPARREALRTTLRTSMLASPLCDARGHTQRLESLIRTEWRRACSVPA